MAQHKKQNYNFAVQFYKGVPISLMDYSAEYYATRSAKRFHLGDKRYGQNIWIPNTYLEQDGTLKQGVNIDFVFRKAYQQRKFQYAQLLYPL